MTAEVYTREFLSAKRLYPQKFLPLKWIKLMQRKIEIALTLNLCCGEGICCRSIARFRIPNLEKMILYHICVELLQMPCLIAPVNGTNFTRATYRGYLASSPGSFHKALPGEEINCPRWKSPGQLGRMAETALFIIYSTSLYGIFLIMYLLQDDLEESLSSFGSLRCAGYRQ